MSINALGTQNYAQDIYSKSVNNYSGKEKSNVKSAAEKPVTVNNVSQKNEEALSQTAQDYLAKLKEKYGDYDFFVGNTEEEQQSLLNSGSKEFSVVISADELEKMAADEEYAAEKETQIEKSVEMCKRISEEAGYNLAGEEDEDTVGVINKISVTIGSDGSIKIFAELEKLSEKQRERIEKAREENAENAEKAAEEEKEKKVEKNPYRKEADNAVKRTTIEASSEEEFMEKLKNIDWKNITESYSGEKFDFSV